MAAPFDPTEFPFTFAEATDPAKAAISKLHGSTNRSDLPGGVLFNRKFHYAPAPAGLTDVTLEELRSSKVTKTARPAILIATDGETVAAEHPASGDARPWMRFSTSQMNSVCWTSSCVRVAPLVVPIRAYMLISTQN